MDGPKWLTQALLAVGAVCLGWIAKDAMGDVASSSAEQPTPPAREDSNDELAEALSALAPHQADRAPPPVELTIVLSDGGATLDGVPATSGPPPTGGGTAGVGGAGFSGGGVHGSGTGVHGSRHVADPPSGPLGPSGRQPLESGHETAPSTHPMGAGGPPFLHAPAPSVAPAVIPGLPPAGSLRTPATAPAGPATANIDRSGGGALSLSLSPETTAAAVGEHIVIAYDGSMVLVGDNGRLTGNTGDAREGGVVAMDAQGSAFTTSSETPDVVRHPGRAGTLVTGGSAFTPQAGPATVARGGTLTALSSATDGGHVPSPVQGVASPLTSPITSFSAGRAVDIAGYEDHSLAVRGERNIVTYDDSNVFIDRDGQINANTGDLDSAGLNAVNTVRSNVSAGPHCDDGCDDESIIQAQAGVFDEGDVAIDGGGNVVWAPDGGESDADEGDEGDDSLPEDNGDDEDAEDDESPDGDVSDPVEPAETREEADSTREAADSGVDPVQNPPDDSLVIGGDGYDDLGIRVDGADNTMTYDDSNVVIGGTGDVNAQIGDADTGGVAVMNTVDSEADGGNSR